MAVRVVSALVGSIIFIAVFLGGLIPIKIGAAVISIIGMYELYTAVSGKLKPVHFVGFAAEIWYVFLREISEPAVNQAAIMTAVIVLLVIMIARHEQISRHDVAITAFGFLYVGILMYCLVQLYCIKKSYLWLPLICAWGSDTFAYFVGVNFGKHKLAPVLSPKKSVEGAVGGALGAGLLSAAAAFVGCKWLGYVRDMNNTGMVMLIFALVGIVAAVFSQVGDIAASKIKREMGVKDYGKIMPGHGGILDRFDSVLFTAPTVYILIQWFAGGWWEM